MHGWAISERIQQISKDVLSINQGSLYPALHRMEDLGWISAEWHTTENNRRARIYKLTRGGEKRLAEEQEKWTRLTKGVAKVLRYA